MRLSFRIPLHFGARPANRRQLELASLTTKPKPLRTLTLRCSPCPCGLWMTQRLPSSTKPNMENSYLISAAEHLFLAIGDLIAHEKIRSSSRGKEEPEGYHASNIVQFFQELPMPSSDDDEATLIAKRKECLRALADALPAEQLERLLADIRNKKLQTLYDLAAATAAQLRILSDADNQTEPS